MVFRVSFSRRKQGMGGEPGPNEAISQSALAARRSRAPLIFFGIFLLLGCGFVVPFVIVFGKVVGARSWVPTPCVIVSSRVKAHRGSKTTTYSIQMVFRYEFQGKRYESHTYDFSLGSSSGYRSKARVVAQYPPGKRTTCYVNPRKPSQAVIDRGVPVMAWLVFVPVAFIAVGLGGLVGVARARRRAPAPGVAPSWLPAFEEGAPGMGVRLKPRTSPRAVFVGLTVAALGSNAMVVVFARSVVQSWRAGRGSLFEAFFVGIFALVGLGLLAGATYHFLKLFNPRPIITVARQGVPLGGSTQIEWALVGRVAAVRRLSIYLEGREQATYRRGTRTITSRETFLTVPIAETTDRYEILAGKGEVMIPPDTIHSFQAPNNKITWSLVVEGEVERWPDIKQEFPIVVLPATTGNEQVVAQC